MLRGLITKLASPFKPGPASAAAARLRAGARILSEVLANHRFTFRILEVGASSGGPFASGMFVRGNRRLEFHVRTGLGLVRYHVGPHSASHEHYMRTLGVLPQCEYPGFPEDPLDPFVRLAHDLRFAGEFLSGDARLLLQASYCELAEASAQAEPEHQRNVGDSRLLEQMREAFHRDAYAQVVQLAGDLVLPDKLTASQRRMLEIAEARRRSETGNENR